MQARALQPGDAKTAIKDWEVRQLEDALLPTLEIPGIMRLASSENTDECKNLLRAVVNLYINAKLQRQGVTQHWARERKLMINYIRKEAWEWRVELLDAARAYEAYTTRPPHHALISISGSVVRFESKID